MFILDRIEASHITIYQVNQSYPLTNLEINAKDIGEFSIGYYMCSDKQLFSETRAYL